MVHGGLYLVNRPFTKIDIPAIVASVQKAQIVTKLLYESDYTLIKAQEVLEALESDARLRFVPESELLNTPITKLASTCGLASSNCASLLGYVS